MQLISIIVPVYNVKEYLSECIKSIQGQTYKNIEILLIDDGATDGSAQICEQYAREDNRIKVIHQENRGLSGARNTGICQAKGAYIAFIDADDMVKPQFLEILYNLIQVHQADIAVCGYTRDTTTPFITCPEKNMQSSKLTAEEMLRQWHGKRAHLETVVWNKLYARRILENVQFEEGTAHEDILISHLLIQRADFIAVTEEQLYCYRKRPNSISDSYSRERIQQDLRAQKIRLRFFKENRYFGAYLRLLKGHLLHWGLYIFIIGTRRGI